MQYCTRCVYPANHPLGLTFDEKGVCSGCRIHEEKDELDWENRFVRLEQIVEAYRNRSGRSYDCIVPVSGARDSYFIVETVKKRLGLRPLLVGYNRHHNTARGIRNLAYLRTQLDCDFVQQVIRPQLVKRVMRETFARRGSFYWHVLAGQSAYPVQTAVRLNIPLIIWGAHQGVDQVGMYSHLDEVEMTRKYRCDHDLMGLEGEDLVDGVEKLTTRDVLPYTYPHDREIEAVGVRGIFLNNYIRWDTKAQHELMIDTYGYETTKQQRTFDCYNDVDCQHYSGAHDYVKYAKWGYGKVSDHAAREIRLRRLTREQAIAQVERYKDLVPSDIDSLLEFMNMDAPTFFETLDRFRDPRIWRQGAGGAWTLIDSVAHHSDGDRIDGVRLPVIKDCGFIENASRDPEIDETKYRLLERGYIDAKPAGFRRD